MKTQIECLALIALVMAAARLPAQTITTQPTNQIVFFGSNVTFSVAVSGTGPFTYQWQFNGTNLPSGIIITVAGNGSPGYSGDGGAAIYATLHGPDGVAVDASGNLFIADTFDSRIRKVDTNGIITTVVGNGTNGYAGDGGAATNAEMYWPDGVAVDTYGNLFIADHMNCRIRKVNTNGIVSTVAGNGIDGHFGDGGAATNANIGQAYGVGLDAFGDLFIADHDNSRVRKVDTNGIITTVAGNGIVGFSGDGGAATNARLATPAGVALDAFGNLLIADPGNFRIRKVYMNGIITTVAGNGSPGYSGDGGAAIYASLMNPTGIALDAFGNLFVADMCRIRKVDTNGIITTIAGNGTNGYSGDGSMATNASLYYPAGVALDAFGNLFIADHGNNRIREVVAFESFPTLTLDDVTTNNAGDYQVIITGTQGSVTSNVATLTVTISPSITSQPQPLTVTNGQSASFDLAAAGSPPLAYQWFFNRTNLPGATNIVLTLQNAFPANAGPYTVVVTNAYGSVTSNPAILTVFPLGINAPTMLANGQFQFSFDTVTGVNYAVQCSTNLTQWFPWVTLGGLGVPLTLIDPNAAGSQQRFYRIILSAQ